MRVSALRAILSLASFASLSSVVFASTTPEWDFAVKESIHPPPGWVKYSLASPDHVLRLRIALPQPQFHVLEQHLMEVSDPDHERYGKYLSKAQVDDLVRPYDESLHLVAQWLERWGVYEEDISRSAAADWATVMIPVRLAEQMLNTTYYVWRYAKDDAFVVRTTEYSLPSILHPHVDLIQPTTSFGRWKAMRSAFLDWKPDSRAGNDHKVTLVPDTPATYKNPVSGATVDLSCNETVTVKCLQQLYNAVGYVPKIPRRENSIGVTGFLEQYANIEDLNTFYADQVPQAVGTSFEFISVNGGQNSQNSSESGIEAAIDTQLAYGLAYPIPGVFWSTRGAPPFTPDAKYPENGNEPFGDWVDAVLSMKNPPQAISTSYADHEQTVPISYAKRVCNSFAQLGARGVSLLFAAGNGGVGDWGLENRTEHLCFSNDGRNVTKFLPAFPASCPYVTSVGATNNIDEVGTFFSGGGFSDYFPRPSYQDKAVEAYLEKLPEGLYEGLYNRHGRGIPDVSALSIGYRFFWVGNATSGAGTSAATPVVTALVALLNDYRLSVGLPTLGFLNPVLYKKGFAGFNDITKGGNIGCGTEGFNATEGWDPVTGLGTPNFWSLKRILGESNH